MEKPKFQKKLCYSEMRMGVNELVWDDPKEWNFFKRYHAWQISKSYKKYFQFFYFWEKSESPPKFRRCRESFVFFSFRLYEVQETNDSTTQVIIRRIHSRSKRNGFWWRLVFYPPSGVKNFSKTKSQVTTHTNFLYFPRTVHFMIHCTPLYCY